jgi:aminopeptidase N
LLAQNEAARPALRQYAIGLLRPQFKQLGWEPKSGESFGQRELRQSLITSLGKFGDPEIVSGARRRFQQFLHDPSSLSPSIATAVIGVAGQHADQDVFNALQTLAQKALTTEEKNRYYNAIFAVDDPALAQQALRLALSEQTPALISTRVVAAVAASGKHLPQAWAYAKANGDALLGKVSAFARNRYFGNVVSNAADRTIADDLETFAATKLAADAMTETRRFSDRIRQNAKRKALLLPQIPASLKSGRLPS